MTRIGRKTFAATTPKQKELLRKIKEKNKEILAHEKEVERLQAREHFDYANDEKAEADVDARELRVFLEEARDLGMNIPNFPIVQLLIEKYIDGSRRRLSMASGSGCH